MTTTDLRQKVYDWQRDYDLNEIRDIAALESIRAELREAQIWDLYGYCTFRALGYWTEQGNEESIASLKAEIDTLSDIGKNIATAHTMLIKVVSFAARWMYKESLEILHQIQNFISQNNITDQFLLFQVEHYFGVNHFLAADFSEALKRFYKCITFSLDEIYLSYKTDSYTRLGTTLRMFRNYEKAIEAYTHGLKLARKACGKVVIAKTLTDFSQLYREYQAYNLAIELLIEALALYEQMSVSNAQIMATIYIGEIYLEPDVKDLTKAEQYFTKAYNLLQNMEHPIFYTWIKINLVRVYNELQDFEKARECLDLAQAKFDTSPNEDLGIFLSGVWAEYYRMTKDFAQAEDIMLKGLESCEQRKVEHNILVLYEELVKLYKDAEQFDKAFLYAEKYINLKNSLLKKQNESNLSMLSKIIETRDEMHRADIARASAEAVANAMRESITYASKIQRSLLPPPSVMETAFADYSVLWEPRDIVGGDIYWIKNFEQGTLLCLADCTGHGVPAALLTVLVVSNLEAIVTEKNCDDTAQLIYQLDQRLSKALYEKNEGCDIAIIFIAPDGSIKMSATGVYVFVCDGQAVVRHKGQKFFVGEGNVESVDMVQTISLDPNHDAVYYLASDGLFDQMNDDMKRFGLSEFKNIVLENHKSALPEVTKLIWEAFQKHKGEQIRYDDVAMLSFKTQREKI